MPDYSGSRSTRAFRFAFIPRSLLAVITGCISVISSFGQELELTDGTIVKGEVTKVAENRVQFRMANGRVNRYRTRMVKCSRDAKGTVTTYAAQLLKRASSGVQTAILERIGSGKAVPPGDLQSLTEDCTADLFEKLEALILHSKDRVRAESARALGLAGTPETVRVALGIALSDKKKSVRRAAIETMTNPTSIAAIESAKLLAEVEKGLVAKDKKARFAFAWIGVKLDSKPALSVLEPFARDSDHHIREPVSVLLAERGNGAGLKTLIGILKRSTSPALRANRGAPETVKQRLKKADRDEKIHICGLVGKLGAESARSALEKLARSKDKPLSSAAKSALKDLDAKLQDDAG